ncbi:MAG: membrane protein insertase YidC [Alistipes sp.]|nr:membrane protein insertase YidC [Alistipes sp.]
MDKKTIIGLVLMVAVFVGFSFYESHKAEEYNEWKRGQLEMEQALAEQQAAERAAELQLSAEERMMRDSIELVRAANAELYKYGAELKAARGAEAKSFSLENDFIKVDFSTKGGKIANVTLLDERYTRYADAERSEQVELKQPAYEVFGVELKSVNDATTFLSDEFTFNVDVEELESAKVVRMTLPLAANASLSYIYTIHTTGEPSRDYVIDFTIEQHNIAEHIPGAESLMLTWKSRSNKNERSYQNENIATNILYFEDGDLEELSASGEKESVENISWIAFKQQYFTSAFISSGDLKITAEHKNSTKEGADFMKEFSSQIELPLAPATDKYNYAFYYGPNDLAVMEDVEFEGEKAHIDEIIPLGGWLIGWVNRYGTVPIFQWLSQKGLGFGLIILILTILVKLIILPLTYKSYMSTAKMRAIRPEMEAINKKYPNPDDAMKKQQATMELYQKVGISPMGGCLPLLIQMPILWAMFRFFPASIELRGEGFLWARDLSSYDSVLDLPFNIPFYGDHVSLFALLMTVALFGYSFISYKQQAATTEGQPGAGMMKFMMVYFMPLMMLCFMNSYSSGLCYYYFLSQMFTMIIMFVIRRSVDDEKVREKLMQRKPKKKTRFQERYEEALRQQQETLNREQRRQRR